MIRATLSISSVLDEAAETVRLTANPWAAVLISASLPYRFAQAMFIDQAMQVKDHATEYGDLLRETALLVMALFVFSLLGRVIYARACRLAVLRSDRPGRDAWRVPPAAIASYFLTGSFSVLMFYAMLPTLIGAVVAAILAGIAIGTAELNERVGLLRPFHLTGRHSASLRVLMGMTLSLFIAAFIAALNITFAFDLLAWLVSATGAIDAPSWPVLFSTKNRLFALLAWAGGLLAIEPFWIAANVVYVRKSGAQESGDDLREWFEELQRAS